MSVLEQLGAHVSRGVRGGASNELRKRIRLHVADTVAAWAAGALAPEGRALAGFFGALPEGVADRIMLHCAQARLSEIDDIHLASATTPGSVLIPAALTLGASRNASGDAIAEAILAGYEAMVRLGLAFNGPTVLYRGIWPTYFTAPFGIAAVAARLLELDERASAQALALALVFAAPGVGHQSGERMGRWLALGHSARHGFTAALSAQAGFTGDLHLLDKDFFASVYSISVEGARLTEGLGKNFALHGVSFKPWCAARQTIAAAQALKEMIGAGLSPGDISEVTAFVPPPSLRMVSHGVTPGDRSSYLTSLPYQLALSAFDPDAQFSVNAGPGEIPVRMRALMEKVKVQADEGLMQHFPRNWPARIVVSAGSQRREALMLDVPGDPARPFDEAQVALKFRRVIAPLLGERAAGELAAQGFAALDADGNAARLLARIGRIHVAS
jgi:2-methylcitrate dehydratase PrpD